MSELHKALTAIADHLRDARPYIPNGNTRDALSVVEKAIRNVLPTIEEKEQTPWERMMERQSHE